MGDTGGLPYTIPKTLVRLFDAYLAAVDNCVRIFVSIDEASTALGVLADMPDSETIDAEYARAEELLRSRDKEYDMAFNVARSAFMALASASATKELIDSFLRMITDRVGYVQAQHGEDQLQYQLAAVEYTFACRCVDSGLLGRRLGGDTRDRVGVLISDHVRVAKNVRRQNTDAL